VEAALLGSIVWTIAAMAADATPLAMIRLYNPTSWDGPAIVEASIGRIASPEALQWDRVRLVIDGQDVPFAFREGSPHWKADLVAPLATLRSEDLLVFPCRVPRQRSIAKPDASWWPTQACEPRWRQHQVC